MRRVRLLNAQRPRTRAWVLGLLVLLAGCKPTGNQLPSGLDPHAPSPLINDGKVVFLVIRANMVAGRSPSKLVPKNSSAYRVAASLTAANLVESEEDGDDGQPLFAYTFDSPNGDWNRLLSSVRNAVTATDSVDVPDIGILDWESGRFVATATPDVTLPTPATAKEYRVSIHKSRYGYTGSYRYVETRAASTSNVLMSETDYDQVLDADGQPVSYHVVTRDTDTGGGNAASPEEETGTIDAGDQYQESTTYDASRKLDITDGHVSSSAGWVVPYHLERHTATGVAEGMAKLPDALSLTTRFTPSWRLSSAEIRSAAGDLVGTVVLGAKDDLEIVLPNGQRLPEPAR